MSLHAFMTHTSYDPFSLEATDNEVELFEYSDLDDESEIITNLLAHVRIHRLERNLSHFTIKDGSDNLVKQYSVVPGSGPLRVAPADVDTGSYRALLTEDVDEWPTETHLIEDTSTGIDDAVDGQYYHPGHFAEYLWVYNNGSAIAKGELLQWVAAATTTQQDFVQTRSSSTAAPAGVALEAIAASTWGKMAVDGFCDILADAAPSGKNAAWYASSSNEELATQTLTAFLIGFSCAPAATDDSVVDWIRVRLNITSGIMDDRYYTESEVDALLHAESHTLASHSDTSMTGAQANELVGGDDTTLHKHSRPVTWLFGQRNTDTASDYWDVSELNSGLDGYRAYTARKAGCVRGITATWYQSVVSTTGDYTLEVRKAAFKGSGSVLVEEVTAVTTATYYQVIASYAAGTYEFSAGDMIILYGRYENGLTGSWKQGVATLDIEYYDD